MLVVNLFFSVVLLGLILSNELVQGAYLRTGKSINGMSPFEYAKVQSNLAKLEADSSRTAAKSIQKFQSSSKNNQFDPLSVNKLEFGSVKGTDGKILPTRVLMDVPIAPGSKIMRKRWVVIDSDGKPKN
jgi:hypothetical protein